MCMGCWYTIINIQWFIDEYDIQLHIMQVTWALYNCTCMLQKHDTTIHYLAMCVNLPLYSKVLKAEWWCSWYHFHQQQWCSWRSTSTGWSLGGPGAHCPSSPTSAGTCCNGSGKQDTDKSDYSYSLWDVISDEFQCSTLADSDRFLHDIAESVPGIHNMVMHNWWSDWSVHSHFFRCMFWHVQSIATDYPCHESSHWKVFIGHTS